MTEEERYLFDLQGYLVVEDVLEPEEVREFNDLLDGYDLWKQPRGRDAPLDYWAQDEYFFHVGSPHRWDRPFADLIGHRQMSKYLQELLGPQFRFDHGHAMFMRQGSTTLELHGGGTPRLPTISYRVDDGLMRSGLTVVAYALCDVGPGDGGFAAVPGSHKSNFACPESFLWMREPGPWLQHIPHRAGSAIIFTEALTHGTLPWTADHERRALLYRYTPGHMAFVGRYRQDGAEEAGWAYPRSSAVPEDALTPELRRMLEPPYVSDRSDTIAEPADASAEPPEPPDANVEPPEPPDANVEPPEPGEAGVEGSAAGERQSGRVDP